MTNANARKYLVTKRGIDEDLVNLFLNARDIYDVVESLPIDDGLPQGVFLRFLLMGFYMNPLYSASYCAWDMFPSNNTCAASSCAVLSVSSFSLVEPISSHKRLCLWERRSLFPGATFTSFNWDYVFLISGLTPFKASCSLVVSSQSPR